MDILQIVATLEDTPAWLRAGLSRVPEVEAYRAPRAGEWCLAEILAHLRASSAILAPRVFYVLVRDHPPLIGFDERAWAQVASSANLPLMTQVEVFAGLRAELVGVLRTLDPSAWSRFGTHETRGRLTLVDIASDLASHEVEHRAQWESVLAALGRKPSLAPDDNRDPSSSRSRRIRKSR